MYSSNILSAAELIQAMQTQASKQTVNEAFKILEGIYEKRQVIRSEEDFETNLESLKAIHDICDQNLIGRFVLPLPAGTGKTTLMVAWCSFIHQHDADYTVLIASLQVDACLKLREQLLDQGIPKEDIGVLYNDRGKKMAKFKAICPSTTTPSKHRFLLVTHARLEERNYRHRDLGFKGEDRSIIFYDEEFRPRAGFNFDIQSLRQDITGFLAVADDLNVRDVSISNISTLKQLLHGVLADIETHLDTKKETKCLIIPTKGWTEAQRLSLVKAAKSLNKQSKLSKGTLEFIEHALNQSSFFLKDNRIYGYKRSIPDEMQQILVLDASYKYSKLSKLDKALHELAIRSFKEYENLTVTYMDCPSGRYSTARMLGTPKKRADLMARAAEYLKGIPANEAVLVFTYKGQDEFETIIRKELTLLGLNMDERIITKGGQDKPKYAFLTWRKQNGTNDYMHCRHMCTIGVLDLGADNIIAQAVAQTEGRYLFDDEALSIQELSVSDCAQRVYQAICRTAIRNHGHNEPCTAALFLNKNVIDCVEILRRALPKAKFVKADPVFRTHETTTDKVLKDVVKLLQGLTDDVRSISTKSIFKLLEDRYGTQLTKSVKKLVMDKLKAVLNQECFCWEHEGRTLRRVPELI